MADAYPNIPANITDERPKHELVKDEAAIAAVALARGQTVALVPGGTGIPTCNIAAAGAKAYVVMEAAAAGALVRLRWIGHAPVRTATAIPTGSLVMADGAGNAALHVAGAGNYYIGELEDAASGQANHLVRLKCMQGEA